MPKKETAIKHATLLAAYILVFWGFYRLLFKLPVEIEELVVKPILWLTPVIYFLKKEHSSLETIGITSKNLFPAIYLSIGLGLIFAIEGVFVNYIKYQEFDFGANVGDKLFFVSIGLSLATAISEEIVFRGFIFNRVWHALSNEWVANLATSVVWGLIHIPITLFWFDIDTNTSIIFLILTTIFGIGSAFVFARTKNVTASILLHIFWEWPIMLFR